MKRFLLTLWQFPQYLLGLIICICCFRKIKHILPCGDSVIVRVEDFPGGISLGPIIIIATGSDQKTIKHELGHSIQSLYLGWIYLLIIGLPSILWAIFGKDGDEYYTFYTEKWADKLGGVKR